MFNPHFDHRFPGEETRFHACVQKFFTPIISNLILDVRVEGREHIPERGALILAVNHVMFYDVVPVQLAIPERAVFFMAKEELFRNPAHQPLVSQSAGLPGAARLRGCSGDGRRQTACLKTARSWASFPREPAVTGADWDAGNRGAARLALDTGTPILPMALDGTQDFLMHFPHRTQVRIKIGSLLYPTPQEKTGDLTERIMLAIARMLPARYQGHYTAR